MKTVVTWLIGLVLLFALSIVLASNFGGENVVLRTSDVDGSIHETRLWIQDMDQSEWLRAGSPDNRWYRRLKERPIVEVKRRGVWQRYRAIPAPHRTAQINNAMARKYGWADWLIGLMRSPHDTVAIRLEPVGG